MRTIRTKGTAAVLAFALMAAAGLAIAPAGAVAAGVSSDNGGNNWHQSKHDAAPATLRKFKTKDSQVAKFVKSAYAYAVFPSVGEGAAVIGASHGSGKVYEHGKLVGHATLTKIDIGPQAGGKTFSELIFFKNEKAFSEFKKGNYALSANASAVAVTSGAQVSNDYNEGVAVFTMTNGGLMAGVSIGGQKFEYTPLHGGRSKSKR